MRVDVLNPDNFILILTAWGGAFLAALWLSLIIWTYRDIRRRARYRLERYLAVLVVAVLFLPGVVIYLILRPPRTLDEDYQHTLEEEALLQAVEDMALCPGCSRRVRENWMVCPNCHTRLKKTCIQCNRLMELAWNLCPYCGNPEPGMRKENLTLDDVLRPMPADSNLAPQPGGEEQKLVNPDAARPTGERPGGAAGA